MSDKIVEARRDYKKGELLETNIPKQPHILLEDWVQHALDLSISDANAMCLSTIDSEGFPSTRIVLARGITSEGIKFFTNYDSAKGMELLQNNKACLNFFWSTLERQVRVNGLIAKLTSQESDEYFASRPRENQIGAWTSPQSQPVAGREYLDLKFKEMFERFKSTVNIPRPPHWGGYILKPRYYEFWQGRSSRLHDRLCATYKESNWVWQRLAP